MSRRISRPDFKDSPSSVCFITILKKIMQIYLAKFHCRLAPERGRLKDCVTEGGKSKLNFNRFWKFSLNNFNRLQLLNMQTPQCQFKVYHKQIPDLFHQKFRFSLPTFSFFSLHKIEKWMEKLRACFLSRFLKRKMLHRIRKQQRNANAEN